MKKLLCMFFALLIMLTLLITPLITLAETTAPTEEYELSMDNSQSAKENPASYAISDEAGLIQDEIHLLSNQAKEFTQQYKQYFIAMLTVSDAGGKDTQALADDYIDFYIDNGYGKSVLLFIIDMDNRQVYIAASGITEAIFSEYIKEFMLDAVYDYLLDGDYYDVFSGLLEEAAYWTDSYFNEGDTPYTPEYSDDNYYYDKYIPESTASTIVSAILVSLFIACIVALIVIVIISRSYKTVGKTGGLPYNMVTNLNLRSSLDTFARRKVTTRHIPPPPPPSSGGSSHSSGGSSHTTSGGHSSSGSGRSF